MENKKIKKQLFKIGDEVEHINDPTYTGTVTKVRYVHKKGLLGNEYQWLYLDGSTTPCGNTSEWFKLKQ